MLVLGRKVGERVWIPHSNVYVSVVKVTGNIVRLGFDAPKEVAILREEVLENGCDIEFLDVSKMEEKFRKERHELRNQLHGARVGMNLLQHQLEAGADRKTLRRTMWQIESGFHQAEEEQEGSGAKVSALLVEDKDNEREMLASILQLSGYDVITARSGEDALRFLEKNSMPPDVMLLDMGLPGLDGAEVVERVKSKDTTHDMKVFVISGRNKQDSVKADKWFQKPLDTRALLEDLSTLAKVG